MLYFEIIKLYKHEESPYRLYAHGYHMDRFFLGEYKTKDEMIDAIRELTEKTAIKIK
jgi:hypothetical protein